MTALVAVWAAVGLAAHAWYPWPIWPALGWGLGVFRHWRAAYAGQVRSGGPNASAGRSWSCHGRARGPVAPG